jgi:hypothetical protein
MCIQAPHEANYSLPYIVYARAHTHTHTPNFYTQCFSHIQATIITHLHTCNCSCLHYLQVHLTYNLTLPCVDTTSCNGIRIHHAIGEARQPPPLPPTHHNNFKIATHLPMCTNNLCCFVHVQDCSCRSASIQAHYFDELMSTIRLSSLQVKLPSGQGFCLPHAHDTYMKAHTYIHEQRKHIPNTRYTKRTL